jgi:hypothetical protein
VDRPGAQKRPSNISPRSASCWKTSNTGAQSAIAVSISDTHVAGRDMVPYEAQALFFTEDADVTVGPMPKGFPFEAAIRIPFYPRSFGSENNRERQSCGTDSRHVHRFRCSCR